MLRGINFCIFVMLLVLIPFQLVCAAEDSILPEKTSVSESSKEVKTEASGEEPSWGITVAGLLMGGLIFMFLEVAIIPGFGAAGVIGLLMLGGGIVFAFLKLSMNMAIAATFGAMVGLFLLVLWFFYVFPHTSFGKKFVLEAQSSADNGCIATRDLSAFVGKEGVTVSMLRPSGVAKIDDERIDVMSDCEYIENGTKIKVVKEKNGRLIVAKLEEEV